MATTKPARDTVLLVRNAAKSDFGGAETYPVSVASILSANGIRPIIASRSKKVLDHAKRNSVSTQRGWWWSRQNWSGRRILLVPFYIAWQFMLTLWYMQLIVKTNARALHIQSKDDFIAGTLAGRILGRRVIWTDHMDLRYVFENISQPFRNPVGKLVFWAARYADNIILISDNEHRLVTSHFKHKDDLSDKIVLIKNGVIDQYSKYPHSPSSTFSFCLASRMVVNKGVGEAIRAYILFKKNWNQAQATTLDIYGDGADVKQFKSLASGHDDIVFHGHTTNAIAKIAASDVFILPSYQEGLSITLLEATMLGKAIIATDIDSNPEVIHDRSTGLLVKVRDVESLSEAMHELVSKPELLHRLEKGARSNFKQEFNLETVVINKIIPLYK